jgi:hypothetical protein
LVVEKSRFLQINNPIDKKGFSSAEYSPESFHDSGRAREAIARRRYGLK